MSEAQSAQNGPTRRGPVDRDDSDRPKELVRTYRLKSSPSLLDPVASMDPERHARLNHQFDPYGLIALEEARMCKDADQDTYDTLSAESSVANDAAVAASLQMQIYKELREQEEEEMQRSLSLAREIQQEEEDSTIFSVSGQDELAAMSTTPSGKAWMLVERILNLMDEIAFETQQNPVSDSQSIRFEAVATDDMVFLAERMFEFQDSFRLGAKPIHVDIGYHFTNMESLDKIKTDGLLSKVERSVTGITSRQNGSRYGDGIYTANTPYAYQNFGDVGILCARLKGETTPVEQGQVIKKDTGIARGGTDKETAILASCSQCLPLMYFHRPAAEKDQNYLLTTFNAVERVYDHQERLQRILDEFFNDGAPTPVHRPLPKAAQDTRCPSPPPGSPSPLKNNSSDDSASTLLASTVIYVAPELLPTERRGGMPSARMEVLTVPDDCEGYKGNGSIVINYIIPSGVQKAYHQHPGQPYRGTRRRAFLPNNREGRALLKRIQCAFRNGLVFCVGTSQTSGKSNVVTWGKIRHKSTRGNGIYGYPDEYYFRDCNEDLDSLGVPDAANCPL